MKRIGTFLLIVGLAVSGLASPSSAGDPPPQDPPPKEGDFCPTGIWLKLQLSDLESDTGIRDTLLVAGNELADHARVEVNKNVLIELCIQGLGGVVHSVRPIDPLANHAYQQCDQGRYGANIGVHLDASAGSDGGSIVIKGRVLAWDHDILAVGTDGKVTYAAGAEANAVVQLFAKATIKLAPMEVSETKTINHRTCLGLTAKARTPVATV